MQAEFLSKENPNCNGYILALNKADGGDFTHLIEIHQKQHRENLELSNTYVFELDFKA